MLIKLADRLHNMRTVYVLPPDKQRSVAEETLEVWCSMAESLGWESLKVSPPLGVGGGGRLAQGAAGTGVGRVSVCGAAWGEWG